MLLDHTRQQDAGNADPQADQHAPADERRERGDGTQETPQTDRGDRDTEEPLPADPGRDRGGPERPGRHHQHGARLDQSGATRPDPEVGAGRLQQRRVPGQTGTQVDREGQHPGEDESRPHGPVHGRRTR